MSEMDYQMALLLQHKLDKEVTGQQKADEDFAKRLQEQFQQEVNVNKPPVGLVYDKPKKKLSPSKSLTDPSWELVDPTPDIHMLFVAFDDKFFWKKLSFVQVSWSKRMTSCAGICSYRGSGGTYNISITLSEPLLKLRPRKDLVETLLHEMIHAYLFVTQNNRDRDGHGPEFHKHMYRINGEAGTNITVYHNFHDEVRLYKQHWWRCDGPCQGRAPFFGMVKRAVNRAPGPTDFWWNQHKNSCNGTFTKIREPEKKQNDKKKSEKTSNKPKNTSPNQNIRNYFPTLKDSTNTHAGGSGTNIKGFKDLSNSAVRGKSNSSSTLVVTNKNPKTCNKNETTFKPTIFNKNENVIHKPSTSQSGSTATSDFLNVRNHWQNKFSNPKKRISSEAPQTPPTKISKTVPVVDLTAESPKKDLAECPICLEMVEMSKLNDHLDVCLEQNSKEVEPETAKDCPICHSQISEDLFDRHVANCVINDIDEVTKKLDNVELISCLACDKKVLRSELDEHLENCANMSHIFETDLEEMDDAPDPAGEGLYNCPFCSKLFTEGDMKTHINECLEIGDCFDDN